MTIVLLTVLEVSITVWAAFQIAKGATFHQLNSLHLKYNSQFAQQVVDLGREDINQHKIRETLNLIRQQPVECLMLVGTLDRIIMRFIGTSEAIALCEKDIADADRALASLDQFQLGELSVDSLATALHRARDEFEINSTRFEGPVTRTVRFVLSTMIPAIIVISLFNVAMITYLSRTITGSIRHTIALLGKTGAGARTSRDISANVAGELGELLSVAQSRIEKDLMNIETNDKLKTLIEDRTASLRLANEDLEQFSYRCSHDLKAPVSRTKRMCRVIARDVQSGHVEEATKNIEVIRKQMESLEQLVEGLMLLARSDLMDDEQKEPVCMQKLVQEIYERLRPLFEEKQVEFLIDKAEEMTINCQRIRLSQTLDNLIANACKYADMTKPRRWVRLETKRTDAGFELRVCDNGLGIPAEFRDQIFSRFCRFHPDVSSGHGLGLSIVERHVSRMGGTLRYEPSADGSIFVVFLLEPNT